MPYPNEHAARLKPPSGYKRFARKNNEFGNGIHAIYGIKGDGGTELQAIRFDKTKFTMEQVRKWLKDHNYMAITIEKASETIQFFEVEITPTGDDGLTGKEWEVTIIGAKADRSNLVTIEGREYVRSSNGRLYSVDGLKSSLQAWEGAKFYDNHLTDEEFQRKQGMRSPNSEWLGTITGPTWNETEKGIKATLKIIEDNLAKKLLNAYKANVLDTIGLSIDTFPIISPNEVVHEGERYPVIEGFEKILSVDLVAEPAAGGRFDRLIASEINISTLSEGLEMDEDKLKELISQAVGAAIEPVNTRLAALEAQGEEAEEEPTLETEEAEEEAEVETSEGQTATQEAIRILECQLVLDRVIAKAKLNDEAEAVVRSTFESKVFEATKLNDFIKNLKKLQASGDPTGRVTESGDGRGARIEVGLSDKEKLELEFYRLVMGNTAYRELEHNQEDFVAERVREGKAYKSWINAGKPNTGNYRRLSELVRDFLGGDPFIDDIRWSEASTLASVTKNAMNIIIAADYSIQQRWYEKVVTVEEVDTIDQATLVRLFGVNTLDVVNKGAAYTELAQDDEEETPAFVKRGNIIAVPLEDLMTDKLQYFRTVPRRLSDTWYNTLSSLTAAVFTVNSAAGPVLTDSGALFNATAVSSAGGHANLLTAALSYTNFGTARTAMRKQTNRPLGAGRRLQMNPACLLVPDDLETTAMTIRNSELIPGSANNDINQYYQKFEVVPVPEWTDANDWALVADKTMFPAIFHIFPRGGRTPQLFTADNEVAGTMFTNDTMRFKVRMLTYRFSATYDCAPVGDWRPLHKNNVT